MTADRTDRALNGVLAVVAVLTAGSVIMLMVALPAIFSSRNNTNAVLQGNEMAACRSLLAYDVNSSKAELDVLFGDGLRAAVLDRDGEVEALAERIPAASRKLRAALEAQRVGNELSRDNPEAFLLQCSERG